MIVSLINKFLKPFHHTIKKDNPLSDELDINADKQFMLIYEQVKPYTMTSVQRMYSLYGAVQYIIKTNIQGDFVECGVWRGGSSMLIALTLRSMGITDRKIYMYDTYQGMSAPTEEDKDVTGITAEQLLSASDKKEDIWCYSSLEEVKSNLKKTEYLFERMIFVEGKVEETIPGTIPSEIALLRLDTDWYESTLHEMNHLYPLLNRGGILIIDDYGHWSGAKKAIDLYVSRQKLNIFLSRIDYTGRLAVKN